MKKRPTRKRPSSPSRDGLAGHESRRAEALTVFWMISVMATLCAALLAVIGMVLPAGESGVFPILTPLMLLTASITAIVGVCITPLVYLYRRVRPPWIITAMALSVFALPFVLLVLSAAR